MIEPLSTNKPDFSALRLPSNYASTLNNGNFGDCKPVGSGVWELRIDWGPGYRVYYAIEGKRVVLLCDGGDKRS